VRAQLCFAVCWSEDCIVQVSQLLFSNLLEALLPAQRKQPMLCQQSSGSPPTWRSGFGQFLVVVGGAVVVVMPLLCHWGCSLLVVHSTQGKPTATATIV
jgi:hypothetical protein